MAHADDVDAFLDTLKHERRAEVDELREAVLASSPELTEHIKWKAPSFCVDGDDRVTLRLQPRHRVELIIHRGAKRRSDTDSFSFEDPSGLVRWLSRDRGVVAFADAAAIRANLTEIQSLVRAWIAATR